MALVRFLMFVSTANGPFIPSYCIYTSCCCAHFNVIVLPNGFIYSPSTPYYTCTYSSFRNQLYIYSGYSMSMQYGMQAVWDGTCTASTTSKEVLVNRALKTR